MARVLLGWELGAGRGHITGLLRAAGLLSERGHEPLFAPMQVGPFAAHGPTWQAPVWPRLLQPLGRRYPQPPATMGDILAYVGLDDREAVTAMLMAWDKVIADARPDAVIAEYAPMLQLAARGRVPVVAWGTGFSLPPDHLPEFPTFTGKPAVRPEAELLAALNESLGRAGRPALGSLPQVFAADRHLVAAFAEFDPYRQWRREATGTPAISGPVPLAGDGEEVFVYFNGKVRPPIAFWQGLVASRLRVRLYDAGLTAGDMAGLDAAGLHVEQAPVAFADIAARSRLLLSHGGLGIVCSGILAGLPQIAIPFDVEKRLNADALAAHGLGRPASFDGLEANSFADFIRANWADEGLRARARDTAPQFRSRMTRSAEAEAADLVESLL